MEVVLVAAAGNSADKGEPTIVAPPARFADPSWTVYGNPIPNIIVVGATDEKGYRGAFSQTAAGAWLTTYAPGALVYLPDVDPSNPSEKGKRRAGSGTSYGKFSRAL